MDNWDEIRTALYVARHGTVSGAAEALGVHHATVIRHVDALEGRMNVKLFQRHARGYTTTEAGQDLLSVAQSTEDQFAQLGNRLSGQKEVVAGDLMITTLSTLSKVVTPALVAFRQEYPEIRIRLLTDPRLFRLEYGEAHVAIRAGRPPEEPDNVVQPFQEQTIGLYAAKAYVDKFGMPATESDLVNHDYVSFDGPTGAPFVEWLEKTVPKDRIVYRASDLRIVEDAIVEGAGIGFMSKAIAKDYPTLVEIDAPRPEWNAPLWLVTHVDLHRTAKVQAFLQFLKGYFN